LVTAKRGALWRVVDGLILHGARVFVPKQSVLLPTMLELAHSVGHEGVQKTLHRLRAQFYIEGDRALVRDFVHTCAVCQKNKVDSLRPVGLLQPLEVPSQVWSDISLDFIEGLPHVHVKSVILTVVDRFSKHANFIALSHPYTAAAVAKAFFEVIAHPRHLSCWRPQAVLGDSQQRPRPFLHYATVVVSSSQPVLYVPSFVGALGMS
jgi:hypothetical protein